MIPPALLGCVRRPPAHDLEISAAERVLGLRFPPDYRAFLRATNGLEGFAGQAGYLMLWAVSDLPSHNGGYGVSEFLTGVTLIGTDGGDTGYGFRFTEGRLEYVSTPLVGMEDAALKAMGSSFEELASQIRDGKSYG